MHLKDKVFIVTGASSGIGAATALRLAREGAGVVLGARREAELAGIAGQINQSNGRAVWLAGDVREAGFAEGLVSKAVFEFGGLDGAFNNAGTTGEMGPVEEMSGETWREVMAVNLDSAFFAARYQIPALRARGGGSLVFTSSFVGHRIGLPGMAAYAAAKAGLTGLVQVLAAEHGSEGIRANALLPGGTQTAMAGEDPGFHDWVASIHALKRMAGPDEIAQAALFLLSDQASFVTGTAMLADGGVSVCKA